ncbi:MAG: P-loop NTPase fold protein [Fimbriimonadaceae bacterium]|nr:P-loop NTPase fold protein [Fimbriimonadaceae bacterium]
MASMESSNEFVADRAWLTDQPISGSAEDRLDRAGFADMIRAALLTPTPGGATVVGLNGGWGTGKTSVAKCVIEHRKDFHAVIEFNPWILNDRHAIIKELILEIGKANPPPKARNLKEHLRKYAEYAHILIPAFISALQVSIDSKAGWAVFLTIFAKTIWEDRRKLWKGSDVQPTIDVLKNAICQDLDKLDKPILVVIDDIDRLEASEIRTVFQLVKAAANFPNISYLVLFDPKQVTHALEGSVVDPLEYIEKIIPVVFDLPEYTISQSDALLNATSTAFHLEHFGTIGSLREDVKTRYIALTHEVLRPYLTTIRKLKKFIATSELLLRSTRENDYHSVDLADFLALEFIRQTEPTFYQELRVLIKQRMLPSVLQSTTLSDEDTLKQLKDRLCICRNADAVARCLKLLNYRSQNAFQLKRFCVPEFRSNYLGFAPRSSIPESTWQTLVSLSPEQLRCDPEFGKLLANPSAYLAWFEHRADEMADDACVVVLHGLYDQLLASGPLVHITEVIETHLQPVYRIYSHIVDSRLNAPNFAQQLFDHSLVQDKYDLCRMLCIGYDFYRSEDTSNSWLSSEGFVRHKVQVEADLRQMINDDMFDHLFLAIIVRCATFLKLSEYFHFLDIKNMPNERVPKYIDAFYPRIIPSRSFSPEIYDRLERLPAEHHTPRVKELLRITHPEE